MKCIAVLAKFRIGRTLPPAASPIGIREIVLGIRGMFHGQHELDRFQSELKQHFGSKHCFVVSSGKAAFTLILLVLKDLYPGREEVLIPAFTCYSAPSSIVRAGLKIRLCDLQPDSLDFDFTQLAATLSDASHTRGPDASVYRVIADSPREASGGVDGNRLLAVVPTHLFGIPADIPRLRGLIRDPGISIVEDAAQAMGETWDSRKLGTLGDVSFFSLGRGKAMSTVEGGIILTDRDDIAAKLSHLVAGLPAYSSWGLLNLFLKAVALVLFLQPLLFWIPRSIPSLRLGETLFEPHFPIRRMSSFQAGLARHWRKRLQELHDCREKNVNRWIAVLERQGTHQPHIRNRRTLGLIRFPISVTDIENREFVLRASADKGLGVMPVYPNAIDGIPELRGQIGAQEYPIAESYARNLVTLPTHAFLTQGDMIEVSRLLSHTDTTAPA